MIRDDAMTATLQAFAQLMKLAAREQPDFVEFEGGPPALATRFYAEEAAAAALAAGATVAADLWTLRTGERQRVAAGTREAGAGLGGYNFQRFEDANRAPPARGTGADGVRLAIAGFAPTRDGRHVFLHPSFPPSADRLCALLGVPTQREAAHAATLKWDAMDLENAIAEAGLCGAMVRTPEEWDASAQGRTLAARPVVEVIKIADSPPEPLVKGGEAPLSGVRVLDLTRVLAGPTCARTLAQYGADVLYVAGPDLPFAPAFVADTNHGKLSCFVDLKDEDGRQTLRELLKDADIFSQGFRVGALERMGFGPLELAALRPGLIYVSINAYGHEGGWRGRPGWEQLAQTVTGMAHVHGGKAGPQLQPAAVCDYTTGFLAAFGALVALHRRALYGGSYMVRVSLSQTGMWVRSLGIAGEERLAANVPLEGDEIRGYAMKSDSGYGPMSHLRPAVHMSATPPQWKRPTRPLGSDPAVWP
jgi:crotonobetainyl-CoA:carnitine CoA-transferase CaiB-like acyl-CoA transferase